MPTAIAAAAIYKIARRTTRRSCNEPNRPALILSSQPANNRCRARYESPRSLGPLAACAVDGAHAPERHLIPTRCRYRRVSLRERSSARPALDAEAGAPKSLPHDEGAAAACRQRLHLDQGCRIRCFLPLAWYQAPPLDGATVP